MNNEPNYDDIFAVDTGQPAQEQTEEAAEEAAEVTAEAQPEQPDKADSKPDKQSPEENSKYAAMRRKYEAEKQQAVMDERARIGEMLKQAGIIDPVTKTPVETPEQLQSYRDHLAEEKRVRELRKGGMAEEKFRELAMELPEVRAAQAKAAEAEAKLRKAEDLEVKARIDEQIKNINMINPSIKSLEDLSRSPIYQKMYDYVGKGMTLEEAYKLADWDNIMSKTSAAQRQAALNAANSKSHMDRTEVRGQGSEPVPDSVKDEYRLFNPKATDAEIAAHYNAYIKKT